MDVPLGEGTIDVELPDCDVTVAEPPGGDAVDVPETARRALNAPFGPSLEARATSGDEVAIVVTDVTRATPDDVLLDALLERLLAAGVDRSAVTVVVGLGLHRPLSDAEIEREYGIHADLVVNHDPDAVVRVGAIDGVPVEVHPAVASADLVCSTGVVEPHQYAGFSGGAKTVVVGAGGEALIRHTHGPTLLGEPGVRIGRLRDNPFRAFLDRAGELAGPDFCVNVAHGRGGVLGVSAGSPRPVVRELADVVREAMAVPIERDYDAVVAGVGAPKDASLYQASRAATYVALGERNPLGEDSSIEGASDDDSSAEDASSGGPASDRGRIVVPARLQEGAGEGRGEQRFAEWLSSGASADAVYEAMAAGYEPGAQRAFVLARVLRDHDVYVTNSEASDVVERCLLQARPTVAAAIEPGSDVLVVSDAIGTLLVDPDRGA